MRKITFSNTLATERWPTLSDLQLVQSKHLQHVLIQFDFKISMYIIQCGYTNISYMQHVLDDIPYILQTSDMHLKLYHIDQKANKCVDYKPSCTSNSFYFF